MDCPAGKKLKLRDLFAEFRSINKNNVYPEGESGDRPAGGDELPENSPLAANEKLFADIRGEYPQFRERDVALQLLAVLFYLARDAHISGGHLTLTQYLRIFLIKYGGDFRAHEGTLFRYARGAWGKVSSPVTESCCLETFLTAAEGLFFTLLSTGPIGIWSR